MNNNIGMLICQSCFRTIPSLTLRQSLGQMEVYVKCKCAAQGVLSLDQFLKGSLHNPLDHSILQSEMINKCADHHKAFSDYCLKCRINLCVECKVINPRHQAHQLIPLFSVAFKNPSTIPFAEIRQENEKMVLQLVRKNNLAIPNLISIERVERNLELLYRIVFNTALTFKNSPSFELMKIHQTLQFVSPEYLQQEKNPQKAYQYLMKYHVIKGVEPNGCLNTLKGHTDDIQNLIETAEGCLTSFASDNILKQWNLTTNQSVTTFHQNEVKVKCLIQLLDGRLAFGCKDNRIRIRNKITYRLTRTLEGHVNTVCCLCQLIDNRLASASNDKTIKLWSLFTYQCLSTLKIQSELIQCLIQLNDGTLAFCSNDEIKLWNTKNT